MTLLQTEVCKNMLLHPKSSSEEHCRNLKINIGDTEHTEYFICSSWKSYTDVHHLISTISSVPCRCLQRMTVPMVYKKQSIVVACKDGVFVEGNVRFMITDDLQAFPVFHRGDLSTA